MTSRTSLLRWRLRFLAIVFRCKTCHNGGNNQQGFFAIQSFRQLRNFGMQIYANLHMRMNWFQCHSIQNYSKIIILFDRTLISKIVIYDCLSDCLSDWLSVCLSDNEKGLTYTWGFCMLNCTFNFNLQHTKTTHTIKSMYWDTSFFYRLWQWEFSVLHFLIFLFCLSILLYYLRVLLRFEMWLTRSKSDTQLRTQHAIEHATYKQCE